MNKLYLLLTSTVVLKRKQKCYICLWFSKKSLTIDALVDSRAYTSNIAQTELDTLKQKNPEQFVEVKPTTGQY